MKLTQEQLLDQPAINAVKQAYDDAGFPFDKELNDVLQLMPVSTQRPLP